MQTGSWKNTRVVSRMQVEEGENVFYSQKS